MPRFEPFTTPLAADQTKTLGPMQVGRADFIVGSVFASHAGTLYIEQSPDGGKNWDISSDYPISAGAPRGFKEEVIWPIVRIRFTNGSTQQTTFRLYSQTSTAGPR